MIGSSVTEPIVLFKKILVFVTESEIKLNLEML